MERLRPGQESLIRSTLLHLEGYANEGLRTLCLAQRKLDSTYYASWALKFHKANTSLHDREEKVSEVSELIERDLELVGSTAIEDKLQENVPQVIQTLRESGIKIWVLTGDKKETGTFI